MAFEPGPPATPCAGTRCDRVAGWVWPQVFMIYDISWYIIQLIIFWCQFLWITQNSWFIELMTLQRPKLKQNDTMLQCRIAWGDPDLAVKIFNLDVPLAEALKKRVHPIDHGRLRQLKLFHQQRRWQSLKLGHAWSVGIQHDQKLTKDCDHMNPT